MLYLRLAGERLTCEKVYDMIIDIRNSSLFLYFY